MNKHKASDESTQESASPPSGGRERRERGEERARERSEAQGGRVCDSGAFDNADYERDAERMTRCSVRGVSPVL